MSAADAPSAPGALPVVAVQGDPRAMGGAQGRACMNAIRASVRDASVTRPGRWATSLLPFAGGGVLGRGMPREIVRHYPHLSERIQGLARGAGQSTESLMELFVRAAQGRLDAPLADPCPAALRGGEGALLCRPLPGASWIVRRSRPEVGFASVELTLPWLATAVAGVNAPGVAVMLAPVSAGGGGRAPAVSLLVQECLQRFRDLAGCIDWCQKRPAGGRAAILISDASGAAAVVTLMDGEREVVTLAADAGGALAAGGCEDRHAELCKALDAVDAADEVGPEIGPRVIVSPRDRTLRVWTRPEGPPATFSAS